MAFLTLDGRAVVFGRISMPRSGPWTADVTVATSDDLSGPVTLLADGGQAFKGAVWQGGVYGDTAHVKLVGGAGGFGRALDPKFYRNAPASIVMGDLLREAGERLSPTALAPSTNLPWYQRGRANTAGEEMEQLCAALGIAWRVLGDGTVWVGTETYPVLELEHMLIDDFPDEGRRVISTELPSAIPATTFDGHRVVRVVHEISDAHFRTELVFERSNTTGFAVDMFEAVKAVVRKMLAPTLYHGQYTGRIVSQAADGSLDWTPDDPRLAGMTGVPIELGIPGSSVKVAPNTRCTVAFRDGSKARPFVTNWDSGVCLEIKIAGGQLPVARQGDMVQVISTPPGTPAYGVIISGNPIIKA